MVVDEAGAKALSTDRPGPVFDWGMRAVAELDPTGFGATFAGTEGEELRPVEGTFPASTFVADGLFQAGPGRLLHFEYTTKPVSELVTRLLIYRGLIMRRYPTRQLQQHVIVLGKGRLTGYRELERRGFALDLRVSYVREMDAEELLCRRSMVPLAVLARGNQGQRAQYLRRALETIGNDNDNLSVTLREVTGVMATIRLEAPIVERVMKESSMSSESIAEFYKHTSFGQDLLAEGRQEGRQEAVATMLAIMIQEKFGDRPEIELVSRRLSRLPEAEALHVVRSATLIEDLAVPEPS